VFFNYETSPIKHFSAITILNQVNRPIQFNAVITAAESCKLDVNEDGYEKVTLLNEVLGKFDDYTFTNICQ